MISAVTGTLVRVGDDRAWLSAGPVELEVLVPAADVEALQARVGEAMTFHTVLYLEGDASGGNSTPRLIGFQRDADRGFFNRFITVKGIGPRKALKALALPAGEVAAAIENGDARLLVKLPQIGKRAADTIIAELSGKLGAFVDLSAAPGKAPPSRPSAASRLTPVEQDAVDTLVALGERPADAERLLDKVKARLAGADDGLLTTDRLVREMLQSRG